MNNRNPLPKSIQDEVDILHWLNSPETCLALDLKCILEVVDGLSNSGSLPCDCCGFDLRSLKWFTTVYGMHWASVPRRGLMYSRNTVEAVTIHIV